MSLGMYFRVRIGVLRHAYTLHIQRGLRLFFFWLRALRRLWEREEQRNFTLFLCVAVNEVKIDNTKNTLSLAVGYYPAIKRNPSYIFLASLREPKENNK